MAEFYLIQASDLHLSARPNTLNPYDKREFREWLKAVFTGEKDVAFTLSSFATAQAIAFSHEMQKISQEADAIVVTGDVATTGFLEDLVAANDYLKGYIPKHWLPFLGNFKPFNVKDRPSEFVLMPGNHDRYTSNFFLPFSNEFENVFGKFWNFSNPNPHPSSFASHKYVRTTYLKKNNEILALCAADFSLANGNEADSVPGYYMGQGSVKARLDLTHPMEALDELIEQTEQSKKHFPNLSIVWLIHYPPAFPGVDKKLRLKNEKLLVSAADNLDIQLILSGHTHKFCSYQIGRKTRVVSCGTTMGTSTQDGHQYLELWIDTSDLSNPHIIARNFDHTKQRFV